MSQEETSFVNIPTYERKLGNKYFIAIEKRKDLSTRQTLEEKQEKILSRE